MADKDFRLCCGSPCSPEALQFEDFIFGSTVDPCQNAGSSHPWCAVSGTIRILTFPFHLCHRAPTPSEGVKLCTQEVTHCWIVNLCLWPSLGGKRQKLSDIHLHFAEHFYCRPCARQQSGPRSGQAQVKNVRNVQTTARKVLPEVVLVLRTMWVQVGGVALLGGDPTVNMTARELAPLPRDGVAIAIP